MLRVLYLSLVFEDNGTVESCFEYIGKFHKELELHLMGESECFPVERGEIKKQQFNDDVEWPGYWHITHKAGIFPTPHCVLLLCKATNKRCCFSNSI